MTSPNTGNDDKENGKGNTEDSRFEKSNLMDNTDVNMRGGDETNDLAMEFPRRDNSGVQESSKPVYKAYESENMGLLREALKSDKLNQLNTLAYDRNVVDSEEAILIMYVANIAMNDVGVFKHLLGRHNNFKFKPIWHALFSQSNIFKTL